MPEQPVRYVETEVLRIAYLESGAGDGWPVILSHGFPYDVHAYDAVVPLLVEAGARVVTPYTRGFGPTRFVSNATMRSGQQAARGLDIIQFADALDSGAPDLGRLRLGRQRIVCGGGAVARTDRRPGVLCRL